MIWWIVAICLTIAVGLVVTAVEGGEEGAEAAVCVGMVTGLAALLINFITFDSLNDQHRSARVTWDLQPVKDDVYAITDLNSKDVTFVVRRESDGGYYDDLFTYDPDDVRINETDEVAPQVRVIECVDGDSFWWTVFTLHYDCRYDLYVPEGGAKTTLEVD